MSNLSRTCLFFLVLILANEVLGVHGRKSKLGVNVVRMSHKEDNEMRVKTTTTSLGVETMEGDTNAFRPTTPGHSPGIGHSVHNQLLH